MANYGKTDRILASDVKNNRGYHLGMDMQPLRFIGEPLQVEYDEPPLWEKSPPCPDRMIWHGETLRIAELLAAWVDFQRRGRMARNMQPQHAAVASHRGSLGVGRFYYRVRLDDSRIFEFYYDRAPKDAGDRKGSWTLVAEYAARSK
jgi:hypothetical protein